MKRRDCILLPVAALSAVALGLVGKTFLPQQFGYTNSEEAIEPAQQLDTSSLPSIDVEFLRCGSVRIPECVAVRGAFTPAIRRMSYSAVLLRHPRATLLYDTGFCSAIASYVAGQPLLFRKTMGNFRFEQSLISHLKNRGLNGDKLDFALLSHLHWDHVSGIPDIPRVPLLVNRVEYDAASLGLLDAMGGLVRRLLGNNPLTYFDFTGPSYEGFRASYDLFGDGSIVLVPLPGHTAGNTGMFINRSNGQRLFLLGDAAWFSENYMRPATMHPFLWSAVTSDDATARQTLDELRRYALRHPEVSLIPMHDAERQKQYARAVSVYARV